MAGLPSDAYATGQSLYALLEGGKVAADHPSVRRGLDFLRETQLADGTWHVVTRTHPFQPPMDSGFPHGKDGWISASATSWAVMALVLALDPLEVPASIPLRDNVARSTTRVRAPGRGEITTPVEFIRDIQPLLERSCVGCHSGERPKGGFSMKDRESLLKGGNRGEEVLIPGQADSGIFMQVVQDQIEDLEMPPLGKREKFPPISTGEMALLRAWIQQGAKWPEGLVLQSSY